MLSTKLILHHFLLISWKTVLMLQNHDPAFAAKSRAAVVQFQGPGGPCLGQVCSVEGRTLDTSPAQRPASPATASTAARNRRAHPSLDRAAASSGMIKRVHNNRGSCLAGAILSDDVMPGVVQLSTGGWRDPIRPGVSGTLDRPSRCARLCPGTPHTTLLTSPQPTRRPAPFGRHRRPVCLSTAWPDLLCPSAA